METSRTMDEAFTALGRDLQQMLGGEKVYYLANPGNWGDALIRQGTLALFRDWKIQYEELRSLQELDRRPPGVRAVIYGGGGAWCRLWNHAEVWVTLIKQRYDVIVLPSTYEMRYAIPNTTFYCRDLAESQANVPAARFCHDMAFYLRRSVASATPGSGEGLFFRTDAESAGDRPLPPGNVDLSLRGDHQSDVQPMLQAVDQVATVHTDRLHVAIAGCLLKKRVHLYPGRYFKNRAVYLSSMRDYFENVAFMGPL